MKYLHKQYAYNSLNVFMSMLGILIELIILKIIWEFMENNMVKLYV